MISTDLTAAITVAHDALSAAEHAPDRMVALLQLRRASMAIQALEAHVARVAAMEASPIPAHWRQQPVALGDMPENVVPLRPVRHIPIHHGGAA